MKKIITIIFILLIGLMVLNGCTSTNVQPEDNQQENQQEGNIEPEQNQQPAGSDKILQPPALPGEE